MILQEVAASKTRHDRRMRSSCRMGLLFCMLLVLLLVPANAAPKKAKKKKKMATLESVNSKNSENDSADVIDGILIEDNPDYKDDVVPEIVGGKDGDDEDSDDQGSDDDSDDDDDDDEDSGDKASKSVKSKKKKSKGTLATLKKHRASITMAVALFAFRKEILALILKMLRNSGKHVSATDVLKLILFVDAMRKFQTGGAGIFSSDDGDGGLLSALTNIMGPNPAFIPPITQHYTFERINEYFVKDAMALKKAINTRHEGLSWPTSSSPSFGRSGKTISKSVPKPFSKKSQTVIILDWTKLNSALTSMDQMREEVAFLLSEYRSLAMTDKDVAVGQDPRPPLEVVLLLESPGGSVAEYGLAGSLLKQLRDTSGVTLTICVDKVAASGGYLLCCTASPGKLFAAPFALIGSIGVIGQLVNIQDLLTGWGIQPLVFRGGKDKAPVGLIGDITDEAKRTTQEMIDQTHEAFKNHVVTARPMLKEQIEKIGSGHVWLGVDAVGLNLVDEIKTSEEYIEEKLREGVRVLKMIRHRPRGLLGPRYGGSSLEVKAKNLMTSVGNSVKNTVQSFGVGRLGLPSAVIDNSCVSSKTT